MRAGNKLSGVTASLGKKLAGEAPVSGQPGTARRATATSDDLGAAPGGGRTGGKN
jgi:hypothetical protein